MFYFTENKNRVIIKKTSQDEKTKMYIQKDTNWKISIPKDVYDKNKNDENFTNILDIIVFNHFCNDSKLPDYVHIINKCYLTE